jgi:hypothetical protein
MPDTIITSNLILGAIKYAERDDIAALEAHLYFPSRVLDGLRSVPAFQHPVLYSSWCQWSAA